MTVVMLPLLLFAASAGEGDPKVNCADTATQHEMNDCAAQSFAEADRALNAQWRITIADVRRTDADIPEWDERGTAEQRLRDAQRAWIVFRDAHCTVYGFTSRGGSMEPMLFNFCRSELSEQRTKQLKDLVIDR
jgi:uncharacterized protein YecT (DUF1311 family)